MSEIYTATNEAKAAVYNAIGYGRKEGKTRAQLSRKTGLSDRIVRAAIHDLRADGHIIVSIGSSGYFFPSKVEEVAAWVNIENSRVKNTLTAMEAAVDFLQNVVNERMQTVLEGDWE